MSQLLSLEDITLSLGGKPLFDGLTLHINERERICLVGKNGAGKTTLMRLMTGDQEFDGGRRFVLPGVTIGYLAQVIQHKPKETVRQYVLAGLPQDESFAHSEYLADMVIAPLGLDPDAPLGHLSGGQLRRAALAHSLVMEPDILLLDEPTNHLDLATIEWLEEYLQGYRGTLVCVSHDRRFLAAISRKVYWLDRGQVKICPYGYAKFDDWLEEKLEQEARELQNLKKQVDAEHGWTQGGVTGRRKRNVRRLRELGRLREKLRADKAAYRQRRQKIEMDALETPNASKIAVEFKNVSKRFIRDGVEIPILDGFSHTILKGDRLGILGANGSGKSSFLKLLTDEIKPDDGFIFRSKTMELSYFDQNRSDLDPQKTLWQTLCPEGGQYVYIGSDEDEKAMHVCGYLKRFLFDPAIAHDKVGILSGGQQNRLLLSKIMAKPGNVLILDEPTNDLDIDTLDMLQEMLADYPGTLIIVSHDRDFLDRTVTEVMAFDGSGDIHTVIGGYSDYIREKNAAQQKADKKAAREEAAEKASEGAAKPPAPPLKTLTYGEKLELEKIPADIDALQATIAECLKTLEDPDLYSKAPEMFDAVMNTLEEGKQTLAETEERWLELEERQAAE